jgi:hypothetical protein
VLTSTLDGGDGGDWSISCPGRFTPRERASSIFSLGNSFGPRADLGREEKREKICRPQKSNSASSNLVTTLTELFRLNCHKPNILCDIGQCLENVYRALDEIKMEIFYVEYRPVLQEIN